LPTASTTRAVSACGSAVPTAIIARSAPAPIEATAASSIDRVLVIACISRASVVMTPAKPSSSRSTGQQATREGGRLVVVRREDDMCAHHHVGAGGDRRPERRELDRGDLLDRAVDAGQADVGVDGDVAMAWEVLRAGGDAGLVHALDERDAVPGDELGGGAERAGGDDRVGRVAVHVDRRREHQVDPEARQRRGGVPGGGPGQVDVVQIAEQPRRGQRPPVRRREVAELAALVVDRDHQVGPLGPQRRSQRGDLLGVDDVAGEQDDPAESSATARRSSSVAVVPGRPTIRAPAASRSS
jgi:hypothetical protein